MCLFAGWQDSKSHHERELKNAEKELTRTKKEAEKVEKMFKTKKQVCTLLHTYIYTHVHCTVCMDIPLSLVKQ